MKDGKVAHLSLPEQGRRVMEAKGCIACHSIDGTARATAPTLKGAFQKEVALTNGETTKRDEAYLRESILKPNAKIVKGFSPVMPAFQGLVSETELNALVEYIKSIQ
jgi:cytochrome c oxidase subunit 2